VCLYLCVSVFVFVFVILCCSQLIVVGSDGICCVMWDCLFRCYVVSLFDCMVLLFSYIEGRSAIVVLTLESLERGVVEMFALFGLRLLLFNKASINY